MPVCLFPSMQPLRRHVEISVLPSEYFWMAATVSPRGSRSVVQAPCTLIYFRLPPLSLQTHRTLPATLDRDSTVPRELCFLPKVRKDPRFFHHSAKFLVFSCHFIFISLLFFLRSLETEFVFCIYEVSLVKRLLENSVFSGLFQERYVRRITTIDTVTKSI